MRELPREDQEILSLPEQSKKHHFVLCRQVSIRCRCKGGAKQVALSFSAQRALQHTARQIAGRFSARIFIRVNLLQLFSWQVFENVIYSWHLIFPGVALSPCKPCRSSILNLFQSSVLRRQESIAFKAKRLHIMTLLIQDGFIFEFFCSNTGTPPQPHQHAQTLPKA